MSDVGMIATAALCGAFFAAGWIARSVGTPGGIRGDDLRSRGDNFPLPLALRLVDEQRAATKRRWSRLRLARFLWRWGRS